jgi:hypothetical protein
MAGHELECVNEWVIGEDYGRMLGQDLPDLRLLRVSRGRADSQGDISIGDDPDEVSVLLDHR